MAATQFSFKHRHALVTGGASGIGFELCKQLVEREATVSVVDISATTLQVAAGHLQTAGRAVVRSYVADITSEQQVGPQDASESVHQQLFLGF